MKTSRLSLLTLATGCLGLFLILPPSFAEDQAPEPNQPNREFRGRSREKPRYSGARERPNTPKEAKPEDRASKKINPEAVKPAPSEKRTWLGIATRPIDPSLRDHLEVPEGFGIQVLAVMPESPAETAGLRSNDVLIRFDDQRLISPEHLSLLVREKAAGDTISLAIIRKGTENSIQVTLGEADENRFPPFGDRIAPGTPLPPGAPWQKQARQQQDYWQHWMDNRSPQARRNAPPRGPGQMAPGRPPRVMVNPGFPLRIFGTEGVLKIDNEQGELTLTRENDQEHLVIEDAEGNEVYNGPFDPEQGVESLPRKAQEQLKKMKLDNLEIQLPDEASKIDQLKPAPNEENENNGDEPSEDSDEDVL